jgi:hypothetical protein
LVEADLRVTDFTPGGPLRFEVRALDWAAPYEGWVENELLRFRPTEAEVLFRRARSDARTLSDYFESTGPLVMLDQEAVIIHPALLVRPRRDIEPYTVGKLLDLDWSGIDLRKESQGPDRDPASIQAHAIRHIRGLADWDVVLDDDGTGEVADVVALRRDGEHIQVLLAHCKYAMHGTAGARVEDLYELCGQAQKSVRWRHYVDDMLRRLIKRERNRHKRLGRGGFEIGTGEDLYRLQDELRLLRPEFTIMIVQPGLSRRGVSHAQLHLLATTELYVSEVAAARFEVLCNK